MTNPAVQFLAGRIVQPVPGIRKSLVKSPEIGIAGVIVAVEAEVGVPLCHGEACLQANNCEECALSWTHPFHREPKK